jgi:tetratricopeptide (TPR) repeat protein
LKKQTLFVNDRPVSTNASFNFDKIITTMEEFVVSAAHDAPFNICVSGGWGTGKTTLLKGLESRFNQRTEDPGSTEPQTEFVTIWFDPWKLSSEEEVRNSLARLVLQAIEEDASFATQAEIGIERRNVLRMLSDRLLKVSPDDVSAFYRADSRMKDTFVEVEDIFRRVAEVYLSDPDYPRRLVIFIDDLDRCPHGRVTEVLESVKLFFDLPGLIFVFALDAVQLERAVAASYGLSRDEARVYLEKIFQLTVPLPRKRASDLRSFLDTNLKKIGVEIDNTKLSSAIVDRYGRNLRNLKLFINWFSFQRRLVGETGEFEEESLFRWLYLESTMSRSINESLSEGAVDFVVALEFLAHGGFVHDTDLRDRYLRHLANSSVNHVALIAYAIVTDQTEVETPHATLDPRQEAMVNALQEDGAIFPTLKVTREGNQLLIDSDLRQMIFLTRSEDAPEPDGLSPSAKASPAMGVGNPWTASEWDRLGDKFMTANRAPEAAVCYLMAMSIEPDSYTYVADMARVFRLSNQPAAAHELLSRAYAQAPNSAYVFIELAYFWDIGIVDERFGSTLYKKAIQLGAKSSNATYYLAMNLEKFGYTEEAYLACLDATVGDFESSLKHDRLANLARTLGKPLPERPDEDQLREELRKAEYEGRYPLPVTEEEEQEIVQRVTERRSPEDAAQQLSRPPF